MKRFFLFLAFVLFTASLLAQEMDVNKRTFVKKENGIFHIMPVVALNANSGQSLVVWEKIIGSDHSIQARIINHQGKPITNPFTLVAGPNASHPWVAHNSTKNEYLLVYDDNPNLRLAHSDVYMLRLGAKGKPTGTPTKVTADSVSTAMANFFPKVLVNPKHGIYTLLWVREALNLSQAREGNNGLVGTNVSSGTEIPGGATVIQKSSLDGTRLWAPSLLDMTFHPTSGKLILAYAQILNGTDGTQFNYYLATLDPAFQGISPSNFSTINSSPITLSGNFASGARIAFQSTGTGFAVFVERNNIKRRSIDAGGKPVGSTATAFRSPKNNTKLFYPALALSNGASGVRGLLIAIEGTFSVAGAAAVWAQALDTDGIALGAPVKLDTTSTTDSALAVELMALPQSPASQVYKFASVYTLAGFVQPGQSFQSAGLILLNLDLTFP